MPSKCREISWWKLLMKVAYSVTILFFSARKQFILFAVNLSYFISRSLKLFIQHKQHTLEVLKRITNILSIAEPL